MWLNEVNKKCENFGFIFSYHFVFTIMAEFSNVHWSKHVINEIT